VSLHVLVLVQHGHCHSRHPHPLTIRALAILLSYGCMTGWPSGDCMTETAVQNSASHTIFRSPQCINNVQIHSCRLLGVPIDLHRCRCPLAVPVSFQYQSIASTSRLARWEPETYHIVQAQILQRQSIPFHSQWRLAAAHTNASNYCR
jgi:hypothetical protein